MAHSPFYWFAKHQKQMLFVLAVMLIVGWLLGPTIMSLMGKGGAASSGQSTILGQAVSGQDYSDFRSRWNRLFKQDNGLGIFDVQTTGVSEEEVAQLQKLMSERVWAFMGAVKMADRMGIKIGDDEVEQVELYMLGQLAQRAGRSPQSVDLKGAFYRRWLERLRMNTRQLNQTMVERLKFNQVMVGITNGVQPTTLGALADYLNGHRMYQLKYVMVKDDDFLKGIAQPTPEQVQDYYEKHCGHNDLYWREQTYEVAYATVSFPAIASRITVSSADIEDWYNKNRDLYRIPGEKPDASKDKAAGTKEPETVKYVPLADVKAQIEESLRRQRTYEQAKKLMDKVVAGFDAMKQDQELEKAVREAGDPAVTYDRTGMLTMRELTELPGIGDAKAEGQYFHALVAGADKENHSLSQVLTAADKGLYVFRMLKSVDAQPDDLEKIKAKVAEDLRRSQALVASRAHAEEVLGKMRKLGLDFAQVAEAEKMQTTTTEFFRNSIVDANRPDFIASFPLTRESSLVGPLRSDTDHAWIIADVVGKRESSTDGFQAEMTTRMASVEGQEKEALQRALMPDGLLRYVGFKEAKDETGQPGKQPSTPNTNPDAGQF